MKNKRVIFVTIVLYLLTSLSIVQTVKAAEGGGQGGSIGSEAGVGFYLDAEKPTPEKPNTDLPKTPSKSYPQTGEIIGYSAATMGAALVIGTLFFLWKKKKKEEEEREDEFI